MRPEHPGRFMGRRSISFDILMSYLATILSGCVVAKNATPTPKRNPLVASMRLYQFLAPNTQLELGLIRRGPLPIEAGLVVNPLKLLTF